MDINKIVADLDQRDLVSAVEDVFTLHKTCILPKDGVAYKVRKELEKNIDADTANMLYEKMIMEEAARRWVLEHKLK